MRISDWSSDVCSSDLPVPQRYPQFLHLGQTDVVAGVLPAALLQTVEQATVDRQHDARRAHGAAAAARHQARGFRSEEHTSELQSLMRISYAVFCLKKKRHPS